VPFSDSSLSKWIPRQSKGNHRYIYKMRLYMFYKKGRELCWIICILAVATDDSTKLMKHGNFKLVTTILRQGVEGHKKTYVILETGWYNNIMMQRANIYDNISRMMRKEVESEVRFLTRSLRPMWQQSKAKLPSSLARFSDWETERWEPLFKHTVLYAI